MEFLPVILVAGLTFGFCFLLDKGFTKVFRNRKEHKSGKAIHTNKRVCAFGLIMAAVGVAALFASVTSGWFLLLGGILLICLGIMLVVQYLTFGVYYDEQGFLLTTFGKKSTSYAYKDIVGQILYNQQGHIAIELHMTDGRTVHLQSSMEGVYDFLDHAFYMWLAQTGRAKEDCPFYDPQNSCWFPSMEE